MLDVFYLGQGLFPFFGSLRKTLLEYFFNIKVTETVLGIDKGIIVLLGYCFQLYILDFGFNLLYRFGMVDYSLLGRRNIVVVRRDISV